MFWSSLLRWKIEREKNSQFFWKRLSSKAGPRTGGTVCSVYGGKAGADPVWPENLDCQQLKPRFGRFPGNIYSKPGNSDCQQLQPTFISFPGNIYSEIDSNFPVSRENEMNFEMVLNESFNPVNVIWNKPT